MDELPQPVMQKNLRRHPVLPVVPAIVLKIPLCGNNFHPKSSNNKVVRIVSNELHDNQIRHLVCAGHAMKGKRSPHFRPFLPGSKDYMIRTSLPICTFPLGTSTVQ
jgi:hypothetical protein